MFEEYFTENCKVIRKVSVAWTDKKREVYTGEEYKWKIKRDSYYDKKTWVKVISWDYTFAIDATWKNIDIKQYDKLEIEGIKYTVKSSPNLWKWINMTIMEIYLKKTDDGNI